MDPKRRLQVLNQANPSLRLASQTTPQLTVNVARPQSLQVQGGDSIAPSAGNTQVQVPHPAPQQHNSLVDSFVKTFLNSTAKTVNTAAEGARNTVELGRAAAAAATHNQAAESAALNRGLTGRFVDPGSGLGGVGGVFDSKQLNSVIDPGTFARKVVATGAGTFGETSPMGAGKLVKPGASIFNAALKEGGVAAGTALTGSLGEQLGNEGKVNLRQTLLDTAAGGVGGAAMPFISKAVGKIFPSAKSVGLDKHTLDFIKKSNSPEDIHALLSSLAGGSSDGLQKLSQELAGTQSKRAIIKAIADLPVEGFGATVLGGALGDAVSREKYGVSPLTGETAPVPTTVEPPKEVRPFNAEPGTNPYSIPLNTSFDAPLPEDITTKALGDAGVDLHLTDVNLKAKDVVKQPGKVAEAVTSAADAAHPDALTTVVNAIAQTPNKDTVRQIAKGLGLDDNALIKKLTKETDPQNVITHINDHIDAQAAKAAPTDVPAPQTNVAPTEAQLAQAAPSEGAVAPEIAPNGSNIQPVYAAADQQVADVVNKNADAAAPQVSKELDSKTIRYTDASTGKTKIATVADLRRDIADFKEQYGTEGLTAKRQATLDQLQHNYNIATFDAEKHMVGATPEEKAAVQQVVDGLSENLKNYDTAAKLRSKERAIKFAKGENNSAAIGGGMDGYKAQLGALKGSLSAPKFNSVNVAPEARDGLLNLIEDNGKSRGWQAGKRLNTKTAILKVLGEVDGAPTPSDIRNLREFFGNEVADSVHEAVTQHPKDWHDVVTGIAGLPKSLMSTLDFSAPRQAGQLAANHPVYFAKRYAQSIKAAFNPEYYNAEIKKMADSPLSDVMDNDMKIDRPGVNTEGEEKYANANIAEKIPLYGKSVIKGSERAYNFLLAGLRHDVAAKVIDNAGGVEGYRAAMAANFGEKAKEASRAYGEMIDTLSGRGGKQGGLLEKHMSTAGATLFSPRLWASKVQQLNPVWYAQLAHKNPAAAKEALQAQAAFYGIVGTTLYLASRNPNVEVGTDMRSADFGKIKIGNTRIDIMGGQQQNMVQAWRQITGEKVNSETGEVSGLGDKYGSKNRFDLFVDMLISKSNPMINTAIGLAKSHDDPNSSNPFKLTDQYGDSFNAAGKVASLAVPLNVSGLKDTYNDTGSIGKTLALNAPGFVGAGVNTYGSTNSKDKGKVQANGVPEYVGKVTPEMVTDDNGKVIQDAKGKPVTVKIPAGATPVEIQALKDQKKQSALKDQYKNNLSTEDQALLGRSKDELRKYVTDGKITQDKLNSIEAERTKIDKLGKVDDAPKELRKGAVTDYTKNFLNKMNTLSKDDFQAFTENGKDSPEAQAVVEALNNNPNNPAGIPKLKSNNQLAKAYAQYEADMIENKDKWTAIDKQNKTKQFWTNAVKSQYDSVAQDLYNEGASADYRALVNAGKIKQSQLDQAIALDDALYKTGFVSLKFSKSFREKNGYGVPSGGNGSAGSGSGGSGSSDSVNAHLDAYLSGGSGGSSSSPIPKFSAKARAMKVPGVNVGGASGKKVSIRL